MASIGLVSCASKKGGNETIAADLYISPLFVKSKEYVNYHCDKWFILSAKYGLVEPSKPIEPYDETLNKMALSDRIAWANKVWDDLKCKIDTGDKIIFLAGIPYREYLIPLILNYGCTVEVPMEGLSIGKQLQWLSRNKRIEDAKSDIDHFYELLAKLECGVGGKRKLSECVGNMKWPEAGLYFFFESEEWREQTKDLRVVRVGTHRVSRGSKATLWNRIRTHRGTIEGSGNHRSSIFRLHVGAAISANSPNLSVSTWGIGQSAEKSVREKEYELERAVTNYISSMSILWLDVRDKASRKSDRAYLERNIIGLLTQGGLAVDKPSREWLGSNSPERRIRKSGLWNLDFINYPYSPDFLNILEYYVSVTVGEKRHPEEPLAPHDWHAKEQQGVSQNQMTLWG